MGDSSASYIRMVQHLIEKCIIFRMTQEECMEALSKYADIKPVITSTVWKELEKENKEFFEAYTNTRNRQDRMSEAETTQVIQNMVLDSSSTHPQLNRNINKENEEGIILMMKTKEDWGGGVDPAVDDDGTATSRKLSDEEETPRVDD